MTAKQQKEIFWGDGNAVHLGWSDGERGVYKCVYFIACKLYFNKIDENKLKQKDRTYEVIQECNK